MKKLLLLAMLSVAAVAAWAEKADSNKPIDVSYDKLDIDEVNQLKILSGNVILTRGTLIMKSERAVLKEDPEGYQLVTLTAAPGKLASFRQKRDGGPNLWVEGHAERIEFDEKADVVKLYARANIRQLEGAKVTQELNSAFISYDNRNEHLTARNDAGGADKPGAGRGSLRFEPRKPAAPAAVPAPGK